MTTTTGRTNTKGDADPTGPIPPICLQDEAWLAPHYLTNPAFPGQGAMPGHYPPGRGHPQPAPLGSEP